MPRKSFEESSTRSSSTRAAKLTQLYRALRSINQAIVRMRDESELFPLVCRFAVEHGGADMAWVGQHDRSSDTLVPVGSFGNGTEYTATIAFSAAPDIASDQGPTGRAFRENQPIVCEESLSDSTAALWHQVARRYGWNSSAAFPIPMDSEPFGILSVYHAVPGFFDAETRDLFEELAIDVGFALNAFNLERQRKAALEALQSKERHFRAYFERAMVGMAATRADQTWMEVNSTLCHMLGYSRTELTATTWSSLIHPEDLQCHEQQFFRLFKGDIEDYAFDKRFIRKDGRIIHVHIAAQAVRNKKDRTRDYVVSVVEDITLRKQAEQLDQLRTSTLESVARGLPLPDVLNQVIGAVEATDPAMICSILLLDREGRHLQVSAAPNLPDFFNRAVNGIATGIGAGSCGTAAFTGNRVVIDDIAHHPYWQDYRDVALEAGLASAWSEPIWSASGKVLGTFAIYHRQPRSPNAYQIALIEATTNLVGLAVEREYAEEERRLTDLIYQCSSEAMVVTDAHNRIITVNPAFTEMTGYPLNEVYGKCPAILKSGKHDEAFFTAMWQQILTCGLWRGEVWNRRKNGELFPVWLTINTTKNSQGEISRYVALASDISHKIQSDELIWRQANFDFLTGLPNRYMFHDRLEQEIRTARREGSMLALMFIDLDHFKDINDSLGHQMGDLLLVVVAERISHCIRESDSLARLGGDEFTVILTHLYDITDVERIAQNLLTALSDSFVLGDQTAFISASVGITLYPNDSTQISQLINNADQAMYAAKNAGRNGVQYYTHALNDSAQRRLRLISDLRLAVSTHQFELYFQPIIELATGDVVKAESLLRWHHPELGLISPADFIPLAEETGLIIDIGDWVFRETASYAARWQFKTTLQFSINMSALQLQSDSHLVDDWLTFLKQLNLAGPALSVEITESLLLNAGTPVTAKLLEFRDAGIQVAIDDFGTGYSALSYLKRFDIDYLKIDQSFIQNLENDPNDLVLSEAIVIMAHKLGLTVIAEGVETEAQRKLLLGIGCDYAQGFLFSRPVPAGEFEQFLTGKPTSD